MIEEYISGFVRHKPPPQPLFDRVQGDYSIVVGQHFFAVTSCPFEATAEHWRTLGAGFQVVGLPLNSGDIEECLGACGSSWDGSTAAVSSLAGTVRFLVAAPFFPLLALLVLFLLSGTWGDGMGVGRGVVELVGHFFNQSVILGVANRVLLFALFFLLFVQGET